MIKESYIRDKLEAMDITELRIIISLCYEFMTHNLMNPDIMDFWADLLYDLNALLADKTNDIDIS